MATSTSKSIKLGKHGERVVDTLVVFAGRSLGKALSAKRLVAFMEHGGSVILAAGPDSDDGVHEALAELGIRATPRGWNMVDFHSPPVVPLWAINGSALAEGGLQGAPSGVDDGDSGATIPGTVVTGAIIAAPSMVGADAAGGAALLAFRGGALLLQGGGGGAGAVAVVRAESGAFAAPRTGSAPLGEHGGGCSGQDCVLVAAVQGDNGARALVLADGGWLLSDDAWTAAVLDGRRGAVAAARPVCGRLLAWAAQRRGVIRAVGLTERRADGSPADRMHPPRPTADLPRSLFPRPETAVNERAFRVGEEVEVEVTLQERVWVDAPDVGSDPASAAPPAGGAGWWGWRGFEADGAQVEVVMLDPYVRAPLRHGGRGLHSARLRLPDQWGVFKFRLQYRRAGWTTLALHDTVTLRPLEHTEFERYIAAAAPHYVAAGACTLLMVVLALIVLTRSSGNADH